MQEIITFVDSIEDFNTFNFGKLNSSKIFSFNIEGHKFLEEKKINHYIAENYLEKEDQSKIFNYAIGMELIDFDANSHGNLLKHSQS